MKRAILVMTLVCLTLTGMGHAGHKPKSEGPKVGQTCVTAHDDVCIAFARDILERYARTITTCDRQTTDALMHRTGAILAPGWGDIPARVAEVYGDVVRLQFQGIEQAPRWILARDLKDCH
jgi:hypothetical protein